MTLPAPLAPLLVALLVAAALLPGCLEGQQERAPPAADNDTVDLPGGNASGGAEGGEEGITCETPPVTAADTPSFRSLDQGTLSGYAEAGTLVIANQSDWEALWARHTSPVLPPPEAPCVAFPEERVAAVFVGERPSGCYGVEVTAVVIGDNGTTVRYAEREPKPDMVCTAVVTQPYHIVAIPAEGGAVAFERQQAA